MNLFFPTYCVKHYIIILAKFFSIGGPIFSTRLKLLAISLMWSSSSLSSGSDSSLLFAKLAWLLLVSTSQSICSSKSEPPYKDSSSSVGGWLSPVSLTTFYLYWNLSHVSFYPFSCQWLPPDNYYYNNPLYWYWP